MEMFHLKRSVKYGRGVLTLLEAQNMENFTNILSFLREITLIGQNQVQGLDYAYTLQGWLKAVNGSTLDSVNDMGHDGDPAVQSRKYIAKDAYGFSLHYFNSDYFPINGSALDTGLQSKLGASYKGLYNGNISSMAVNIGILNAPKLYNYRYDQ